jgi:hypothetical protein
VTSLRLLAIVPFLNEADYLPRFLASMAAQTRRPDRLLLVDDGSTDGSFEIASAFAQAHAYALALRRPPRTPARDRLATAAELRAFAWGLQQAGESWDVLAKLDADLCLTPETIDVILGHLARDPQLGMAGSFLSEEGADASRSRIAIRAEHVHGATKFYRRECWEQIAPLPEIIGWDTLDEVHAGLCGWRTQSFELPGGDPLHMRPRASYDGVARGHRRSGAGAYAKGDHPLHVVLFALRQTSRQPGATGAVNYLAGWAGAAVRRHPRADPELRASVRREELRRIRRRILRIGASGSSAV